MTRHKTTKPDWLETTALAMTIAVRPPLSRSIEFIARDGSGPLTGVELQLTLQQGNHVTVRTDAQGIAVVTDLPAPPVALQATSDRCSQTLPAPGPEDETAEVVFAYLRVRVVGADAGDVSGAQVRIYRESVLLGSDMTTDTGEAEFSGLCPGVPHRVLASHAHWQTGVTTALVLDEQTEHTMLMAARDAVDP